MCFNEVMFIFNNLNNLFENSDFFYKKYKLLFFGYNIYNINLILKRKFM